MRGQEREGGWEGVRVRGRGGGREGGEEGGRGGRREAIPEVIRRDQIGFPLVHGHCPHTPLIYRLYIHVCTSFVFRCCPNSFRADPA